jgi:hypothetical protein
MSMTVEDRVQAIATFRYIEVRLMEIVAAWTPTTPEMEAKVMFGRHIWDFAQHADALGKRTFEMRRPEQFSQKPVDAYVALLDELERVLPTADRLAALYDAFLPGLEKRYQRYLSDTDQLLDAPSVLILERIVADIPRQRAAARELRTRLGLAEGSAGTLGRREAELTQVVALQEARA